jgi:hypothetical protein
LSATLLNIYIACNPYHKVIITTTTSIPCDEVDFMAPTLPHFLSVYFSLGYFKVFINLIINDGTGLIAQKENLKLVDIKKDQKFFQILRKEVSRKEDDMECENKVTKYNAT